MPEIRLCGQGARRRDVRLAPGGRRGLRPPALFAFDKRSGEVVYRTPLDFYSWSSPVAFYNEDDRMFLLTGDVRGNVYLIEGCSGRVLFAGKIGANFESSPVVVGDRVVVGSRGDRIYRLHVQ